MQCPPLRHDQGFEILRRRNVSAGKEPTVHRIVAFDSPQAFEEVLCMGSATEVAAQLGESSIAQNCGQRTSSSSLLQIAQFRQERLPLAGKLVPQYTVLLYAAPRGLAIDRRCSAECSLRPGRPAPVLIAHIGAEVCNINPARQRKRRLIRIPSRRLDMERLFQGRVCGPSRAAAATVVLAFAFSPPHRSEGSGGGACFSQPLFQVLGRMAPQLRVAQVALYDGPQGFAVDAPQGSHGLRAHASARIGDGPREFGHDGSCANASGSQGAERMEPDPPVVFAALDARKGGVVCKGEQHLGRRRSGNGQKRLGDFLADVGRGIVGLRLRKAL
mmetsp:Transcript_128236/g.369319  ORF Transcript_128236/g.369319 Transcript_128236/m.369319 type:complete len:330 (-) Transcript_128236:219-1208(-)